MTSWKNRIQNSDLLSFKIIAFVFLMTGTTVEAKTMNNEIYLFSFKSVKSTCILRVNDLPAIDTNGARQGTMSAGFNFSAFLENGSNRVELLMGPQNPKDPDTLYSDSSCEVVVSKDSVDKSAQIANFRLSVDRDHKITGKNSAGDNTGSSSPRFLEGFTQNKNDYGMYKLEAEIKASNLQRWSWVNATPVTENDIPKIRAAYEQIWTVMNKHDVQSLKSITQVSNEEMAAAEGTSPEIIFVSTGLPEHVANSELSAVPIDWSKYKLISYRGGRLFRLGVGYFQNSPLRLANADGKILYAYKPYFSIIDGKVVLVR